MKKCPKCLRTYDDGWNKCLLDNCSLETFDPPVKPVIDTKENLIKENSGNNNILAIAKEQRIALWLILANIISYPLMLVYIGGVTYVIVWIWQFFNVYNFAKALNKKFPLAYVFFMFLPVVKFLILLNFIQSATKILNKNNIKAGIMGAKKDH